MPQKRVVLFLREKEEWSTGLCLAGIKLARLQPPTETHSEKNFQIRKTKAGDFMLL